MLAAVILAAGESRRMGKPKATLPFPTDDATPGKITFLEHLLAIARHPKVGELRVVLGAHAEKVRERIKLAPSEVIINEEWQRGQLSSIQAGIRALPKVVDGALLLLVDHPLITHDLVSQLIDAFYGHKAPIVIPTHLGQRGHPVIFPSRLFEELLAAPQDVGARAVVWAHQAEVVEVSTGEAGVVLNLNDPEAFQQALKK
jgi:molybdenum cofactor cytidylyltransferase